MEMLWQIHMLSQDHGFNCARAAWQSCLSHPTGPARIWALEAGKRYVLAMRGSADLACIQGEASTLRTSPSR